ncbi:hypothetical protein BC332_18916 [Capsicum chinense]|nr:hypothetical protein BC332_18916 [Capsicum chinense]
MTESGEPPNEASFLSELGMFASRKASADKDSKVKASLFSWLKPSSINQDEGKQHKSSVYSNRVHYDRTPGDRPILGLVAAHWKEDENWIPNSTNNNFKADDSTWQDQKVSWHATPFEERLEKALSQESIIPQRKLISGTTPFAFNNMEESDTALSQVHK